jgi:hypothetical protein
MNKKTKKEFEAWKNRRIVINPALNKEEGVELHPEKNAKARQFLKDHPPIINGKQTTFIPNK